MGVDSSWGEVERDSHGYSASHALRAGSHQFQYDRPLVKKMGDSKGESSREQT